MREKKNRRFLFGGKKGKKETSFSTVTATSGVKQSEREESEMALPSVNPFLALHGKLQDEKNRGLAEELKEMIFLQLEVAMKTGNPGSLEGQILADLHRRWICLFWREGMYSKAAHLRLADIYIADRRFTAWYDRRVGVGGAQFLRDAVEVAMYRVGMNLPEPEFGSRTAVSGKEGVKSLLAGKKHPLK